MKIGLLHRNEAAVVREVRCGGGSRGPGAEEHSPADELVLVRAGLFVRTLGRERIVADATRVLFFRRGEVYRTAHPTGEGDVCTTIEVVADGPLPPSAPLPSALDLAHRRLVSRLSRRALSPLEADEAVESLIARLLAHARRASADATLARRRVVDEARERIAARFTEAVRLHEVAGAVGCSPFHLCRAFRRATGTTMGRFQSRLRVRAALERLSGGERDLTRLALDLGFYDHSHFCRAFRRETGGSPSAWRASNSIQAPR